MPISHQQFVGMLARINRTGVKHGVHTLGEPVAKESDLHDEIQQFCRERGWIAFHGSTAHRTHRTEGEPDFVIFADGGRVFAIECKTRLGKLSTAQLGVVAWAKKLGHTVHVVHSMSEFREAIK